MRELDDDAITATPLNEAAFDCAIEAALEADNAALEPRQQLEYAVRAYLWALPTTYHGQKTNDVMLASLRKTLESGISDDAMKAVQKQTNSILETIESDLNWRFKDELATNLVCWVADLASSAVDQLLRGNEDQMRRYLHCERPYGSHYNGRQDGYHTRDPEGQHPIIHGQISSADFVNLRRELVNAHRDLITDERIKDLEDTVESLRLQVNRANADKEKMWERTRRSE